MSPLPDRIADRTSFIHDEEFINNFFREPLGPDKIWHLNAYEEDPEKLGWLIKSMGIDFDLPIPALETYVTGTEGKDYRRHKIYVTSKKGVYLDQQSDKGGSVKRTVFVRLGENINKGYIASLRNE